MTGGKRAAQGGSFSEPIVLTDDDRHGHHERGNLRPVALLCRFKGEDEVVKMANDTLILTIPRLRGMVRGQAASFYCRDIGRI